MRQLNRVKEPASLLAAIMRRWRDAWIDRAAHEGWGRVAALVFVVLPPTLLVLALALSLNGVGYGLWSGVLSLFVLLLVLLDQKQPTVLLQQQESWRQSDDQFSDALRELDSEVVQKAAISEFVRARQNLLMVEFRELFVPLFWFFLLGPVAAIAYYFLRIAAEREELMSSNVQVILFYAEWPVVRVLTLSFALAGDFTAAWQQWRELILKKEIASQEFLDQCATAAQPVKLADQGETKPGEVLGVALQAVAALLHRVLIIWVVLSALHTLWP
jgi:AmpE protein